MKMIWAVLMIFLSPLLVNAQDFSLNQGFVSNKNFLIQVPYENKSDLVIVEVFVAGKNRRFLLDTGAPTVITESINNEGGFSSIGKIMSHDVNNKKAEVDVSRVTNLQLCELAFNDIPALVTTDDNEVFNLLGIEGIIGSNLLKDVVINISSRTHTITVTDDASRLALNGAFSDCMDTKADNQSSPLLTLSINGNVREDVLFDTGFDGFYNFSMKRLHDIKSSGAVMITAKGGDNDVYGMYGAASQDESVDLSIKSFELAGFSFENTVARTTPSRSKIGAQLLRCGDVTLDYKNQHFYFQPYNGTSSMCMKTQTEAYYCVN